MSILSPGGALGGPGEEGWAPKNKNLLYIITHRTPGSQNSFDTVKLWLGAYVKYSLWGGLGEPGEACVKCGGKETTLGAHAPMRGASPKNKTSLKLALYLFC